MKIEPSTGIQTINIVLDKAIIRQKIEKVLRKWNISENFYRDIDFEKLLDECVEDL